MKNGGCFLLFFKQSETGMLVENTCAVWEDERGIRGGETLRLWETCKSCFISPHGVWFYFSRKPLLNLMTSAGRACCLFQVSVTEMTRTHLCRWYHLIKWIQTSSLLPSIISVLERTFCGEGIYLDRDGQTDRQKSREGEKEGRQECRKWMNLTRAPAVRP